MVVALKWNLDHTGHLNITTSFLVFIRRLLFRSTYQDCFFRELMSSCREQLLFSERENLPKVLAFRFESSILKDEEVEQIFLPAEALNDDGDTATANLLGDDGKYLNKVSIRMESTGQMNTFSGIPVTRTGENNDQNWRFTGSTLSEKRIVVQYVKELKDLGNRARARLEEEKMKRPEIQILDRMPTSDPDKKTTKKATSFSANIASQKPWTASIGRKRKLDVPQTKSTKPKPMKRTETSYKTTDWVPDVSHIELPEKGKVSVTVKLHGVPLDCTVENVKKFFAGLQPESISILLPNNAAIKQLDASNPRRHYNDKIDIRLRIIVSFKSASMAILASDRSGETMVIQQNGREKQFVIAVTALCEELDRALSMVVRKQRSSITCIS